jgi:FkbM family methyltransferase
MMARRRAPGDKQARRAARKRGSGKEASARQQDARDAFFERAGDFTRYLGAEADGARFVVATRSQKLGRHLFSKQGRPEFGVLRRAVSVLEILIGDDATRGRLFVDVGANIGTSTISALVSHHFGSAVCIEPEHENYLLLRANLALNELDDVRTIRAAASDRMGRANLVVVGGPPGKTWVALDPQLIRDKEADLAQRVAKDPTVEPREMVVSEVELVTLDRLVESGVLDADDVGMLWIDVEGHEGHVLGGASALVALGVPIVFEFDPDALERRGDRDTVYEVAERSYTHFVDLRRRNADPNEPRFQLHPVAELSGLADRFLDQSLPARYTDLLLLRLSPHEARKDLPDLMSRSASQGAIRNDPDSNGTEERS